VLNTEAHPFPRFDASRKRFKTGWKRIPRDKEGELIRPKEEEKKEDEKKVDEKKEAEEAKVETKKEVVEEEESKSKGKVTKKARVMRVPNVDKAR
jgi:hypothetical protein